MTTASRTWADTNVDFVPQESELGPLNPSTFGTNNVVTRVDPALLSGWGVRPYDWEGSLTLQHELRPGLSVVGSYYRRWFGNQTVVDNLKVTPSDFDQYCVTAPVDARLPNSGQQICGLYDVKPSLFGQTDNLVQLASKFGTITERYNGFDVSINSRFRGRMSEGRQRQHVDVDGAMCARIRRTGDTAAASTGSRPFQPKQVITRCLVGAGGDGVLGPGRIRSVRTTRRWCQLFRRDRRSRDPCYNNAEFSVLGQPGGVRADAL